ncbi:MAG TPA: hypothetical protein VMW75_11220 [Thermoanaerobaculia bacterium]|nr:hypothetical protein [Thermoanaerobaculia bacterium]
MENEDREWTEQERAELAALLRQSAPPKDLERRVIGRLVTAGLIGRRRAPVAHRSWLLAAGLALLAVGFGLGRWQAPSSNSGPMHRYLLLMHEDASFRPNRPPAALRAEVGRWARRLERAGELVEGDRLGLQGHLVTPSGQETGLAPGDVISGFFVIRAVSDERALAIALTCPHLAFGGHIELRRIQPS